MTLQRTLVGERLNKPSSTQIKNKIKQSATADDFQMKPGYIYTVVRAISARINQNFDGWPAEELKKSYHTFVGKPVFVNHENYDPKEARGVVVASRYVENGRDKYIEVVQEIDAQRFPKLAHEIRTGGLDSVSMGAEAAFTICSYCSHKATDESDMCDHVKYHKGEKLQKHNRRTGKVEDVLVYESCHKLSFFELSYVFEPADETAVASKVLVAAYEHSRPPTVKNNYPWRRPPDKKSRDRFDRFRGQPEIGDSPDSAEDLTEVDPFDPRSYQAAVLRAAGMLKEAPFAGYKDFAACVAANQDKSDPEAYCGSIKHKVEDKTAAATLNDCPPGAPCDKAPGIDPESLSPSTVTTPPTNLSEGTPGGSNGAPASGGVGDSASATLSDATGGSPGKPGADGLLDNNRALYNDLEKMFPGSDIGKYRVDDYHEHDHGALDFMTSDPSQAAAVRQKAFDEGAPYVLWQQQQWNSDGTRSKMDDRGSPTQNHMDHVHIAPFTPKPMSQTITTSFEGRVLRMAGYKLAIGDPSCSFCQDRAFATAHENRYDQAREQKMGHEEAVEYADKTAESDIPYVLEDMGECPHAREAARKAASPTDDYLEWQRRVENGEIEPERGPKQALPDEHLHEWAQRSRRRDAAAPVIPTTPTAPSTPALPTTPTIDVLDAVSNLVPDTPQIQSPATSTAPAEGREMQSSFESRVLRLAYGEIEAPHHVDTLREEGSAPEDANDDFHHYVEPPDGLRDPDLTQAGQLDRQQQEGPEQGVGGEGGNPEDDMGDPTPYMVLKIPMPGQAPPGPMQPPPQPGQPMPPQIPAPPQQQPPQIPMQNFAHRVLAAAGYPDTTLENGRGVSQTSRKPRKGQTMGRSKTSLARRGKVASRGNRQHFAEGPYTDGGPYGRNDEGEQVDAFITDVPPEEPVKAPTDDTPNISNTKENLVARVQAGRQQLLRDAKALAAYQARQGSRRQGEALEEGTVVNPTVQDSASEALTGDDFQPVELSQERTDPRQAAVQAENSLRAFQAFDQWLHQATGHQAREHTAKNIRLAADEWAKRANADVRVLFPALGIVLRQARKNETAGRTKGAKMRKRADDKLEIAAPDERVDVEAPTANTTDEEAQESQFDLSDFADNAGDDLADPDLSTDSQFWAPGEGNKKSSRKTQAPPKKPTPAGGILAVRAAEAYINAGLEPNTTERKYQLAGVFETQNRDAVQRDIALLERVAQVQSQTRQKVASGRTRGAATPIPPGLTSGGVRRAASVQRTAANDPINDALLFD